MRCFAIVITWLLWSIAPAGAGDMPGTAEGGPGEAVYRVNCASCHDGGVGRAPQLDLLSIVSPRSIYRSLNDGTMRAQGAALSEREKMDVAEFITNTKMDAPSDNVEPPQCKGQALHFDSRESPVFSGAGLSPDNRRFISAAKAGIDKSNAARLHLAWAIAFPDAARVRSEPALGWGALFIGSHNGGVYALDRKSGCLRWRYQASGEVRTGIVLSDDKHAYFADVMANVYALNAQDGTLVWRVRADDHPSATVTGTPALHDGILYVPVSSLEWFRASDPRYACCSFRGSILALDAVAGAEKWRHRTILEPLAQRGEKVKGGGQLGPSGAGVWNNPAIDAKHRRIYFGTGNNYSLPATGTSDSVMAINLNSGQRAWVTQASPDDVWNVSCELRDKENCPKHAGPDHDFGAPVILDHAPDGRYLLFAGQKSGAVFALDPKTGDIQWSARPGGGGPAGGVTSGMASNGRALFVPVNDRRFPISSKELHPGLYALDVATGHLLWSVAGRTERCGKRQLCDPGFSQAITATSDLVLAGSNDGWFQILDAANGAILWQYDTTQPVTGLGGAKGAGGSLGGSAGPIAYEGMLFVSSGYGYGGLIPGNVLLAFSVE